MPDGPPCSSGRGGVHPHPRPPAVALSEIPSRSTTSFVGLITPKRPHHEKADSSRAPCTRVSGHAAALRGLPSRGRRPPNYIFSYAPLTSTPHLEATLARLSRSTPSKRQLASKEQEPSRSSKELESRTNAIAWSTLRVALAAADKAQTGMA